MESALTNHTRRGGFYRRPHSAAQDMGIEKANYGNKTKSDPDPGQCCQGNAAVCAADFYQQTMFQQLYNAADSLIVGNFLGARRSPLSARQAA